MSHSCLARLWYLKVISLILPILLKIILQDATFHCDERSEVVVRWSALLEVEEAQAPGTGVSGLRLGRDRSLR